MFWTSREPLDELANNWQDIKSSSSVASWPGQCFSLRCSPLASLTEKPWRLRRCVRFPLLHFQLKINARRKCGSIESVESICRQESPHCLLQWNKLYTESPELWFQMFFRQGDLWPSVTRGAHFQSLLDVCVRLHGEKLVRASWAKILGATVTTFPSFSFDPAMFVREELDYRASRKSSSSIIFTKAVQWCMRLLTVKIFRYEQQ